MRLPGQEATATRNVASPHPDNIFFYLQSLPPPYTSVSPRRTRRSHAYLPGYYLKLPGYVYAASPPTDSQGNICFRDRCLRQNALLLINALLVNI